MRQWPGDANKEHTTFGRYTRSQLMSLVRSRGNTTTELRLVQLLRKARIRGWRRHNFLPGSPDFVWGSNKLAVFVDGCFWHGHNCGKNITPKTNAREWRDKIGRNKTRDRRVNCILRRQGWAVVRIWECQLAKNSDKCLGKIRKVMVARNSAM